MTDKYAKVPGRPFKEWRLTGDAIQRRQRVYDEVQRLLPAVIERAMAYHQDKEAMMACDTCAKVLLDVYADERIRS